MEEIIHRLKKFVKERKWEKYHTPKNLAMSISIEAAELMEHFQWNEESFPDLRKNNEKRKEVEEELADVMIYCLLFFYYLGSDVETVIMNKIQQNEKKYPYLGKKQNIYKKEGNSNMS